MTVLAVQYLESNPGSSKETQETVRKKLRAVLELMPVSLVLIGWEIGDPLLDICREETERAGGKLFRWHPLLTGDGEFVPRSEWQTIGPGGESVPGFRNMPEFTFVCPNRRAVQAETLSHLQRFARSGRYDGIFLDRIRFPSPAANPARWLACFCEECQEKAAKVDLDLEAVKAAYHSLLRTPGALPDLLALLMRPTVKNWGNDELSLIGRFLQFRLDSISRFVAMAAELIVAAGLEVGLDTFSPTLTPMVGQDLKRLDEICDWIKVMTYGHALGPSGLPFETLDLANWLTAHYGMGEGNALRLLSGALQMPLPESFDALRDAGVEPGVLQAEVERGRSAGVSCLLAGIELVELEGVTSLNRRQILADLAAFNEAGADGLVFSWDLQLMPIERLALVAETLARDW